MVALSLDVPAAVTWTATSRPGAPLTTVVPAAAAMAALKAARTGKPWSSYSVVQALRAMGDPFRGRVRGRWALAAVEDDLGAGDRAASESPGDAAPVREHEVGACGAAVQAARHGLGSDGSQRGCGQHGGI